MNASASIFPQGALLVLKPVCDSRSCDRKSQTAAVRAVYLALKSKAGEEAATPGQPVALSRVSGSFPLGDPLSRITATARSPQSSGRARNHHVSLEPTFV